MWSTDRRLAAPGPQAAPGWFQRMVTATRSALGRPPQAAVVEARDLRADDWVMIVQTSAIPADTVVDICRRYGARQVDKRESVEVSTDGA